MLKSPWRTFPNPQQSPCSLRFFLLDIIVNVTLLLFTLQHSRMEQGFEMRHNGWSRGQGGDRGSTVLETLLAVSQSQIWSAERDLVAGIVFWVASELPAWLTHKTKPNTKLFQIPYCIRISKDRARASRCLILVQSLVSQPDPNFCPLSFLSNRSGVSKDRKWRWCALGNFGD